MSVREINSAVFDDSIKSGVSVVDFNADWCGPCKMLGPVLAKLSEEFDGKASFYAVNVDHNPDLAARYGIISIPFDGIFKA